MNGCDTVTYTRFYYTTTMGRPGHLSSCQNLIEVWLRMCTESSVYISNQVIIIFEDPYFTSYFVKSFGIS